MLRALTVRLGAAILSLLLICFLTFMATELAPGDAARQIAGEKATPAAVERIREELGLNKPWYVRFGTFVTGSAKFDFGKSYVGVKEPVSESIQRTLPMTARIAFWALFLAAGVGIVLGSLGAIFEGRWIDKAVLTFGTLGVTIPNFVLAPILILVLALNLDLLPTSWSENRVAPDFYYLLMPVLTLSLRPMATLTRLTRASMIDTLGQDFIRLAIAKGVPRFRLYIRHGLRNAIMPVVTAIGTSFGFLLTGSFVVERAFTIPGMGSLAIEAIQKRDVPTIQATTLVAGFLFIFINLLVDLLQPVLDPRVRGSQV